MPSGALAAGSSPFSAPPAVSKHVREDDAEHAKNADCEQFHSTAPYVIFADSRYKTITIEESGRIELLPA